MSSDTENDEPVKPRPSNKKKFHNGWTRELEDLMADWADKAACYRWMHETTSRHFARNDRNLMFPIIILSTLTGTANFAVDSFVGTDPDSKKLASGVIGGLSIFAGILTTLANKLAYAKDAEGHRVAGVSWGKFNRLLCIEMRLHPDERTEAYTFLKMFRIELDRLIEQSPSIPELVIKEFNKIFKKADVSKPEITGILEHTIVYKDTGERLKKLAAEAAITIQQKKGLLKQIVLDDLEMRTKETAKQASRQVVMEILAEQGFERVVPVTEEEKEKEEVKPLTSKQEEALKSQLASILEEKMANQAPSPSAGFLTIGSSGTSGSNTIHYTNNALQNVSFSTLISSTQVRDDIEIPVRPDDSNRVEV